jgi:hypothetical protein
MNICGELRSRLYRLLTPIKAVRTDPVPASITYYGPASDRSQAREPAAGERDR